MTLQQPPPMPALQVNLQDDSHLKLLSVFHYVMGALYILGIGFLILHFMFLSMFLKMAPTISAHASAASTPVTVAAGTVESVEITPEASPIAPAPAPVSAPPPFPVFPKEMMGMFVLFYVFFGIIAFGLAIGNVLSGRYIGKRKHMTFSYIVSGINCLQFPFGTTLGVFTFVVLSRPSVKSTYEANLQI